jgi:uncharacterized glyoxalase superfamily protein PhnB
MPDNRTMPPVSVIPELIYRDVGEAVTWLCHVFGFTERWRAGNHRAQLAFGNGALIVAEARQAAGDYPGAGIDYTPDMQGPIGHEVMVRVTDVDAHHAHAHKAGARILSVPQDYPYGERQYGAVDLAGHHWTFSQSIADLAPEAWGGTSGPALPRS